MILLADPKKCTGCSACRNVCSRNAIAMVRDREGFLVPSIDDTKCIKCGLCSRKCPIINPPIIRDASPKAYALISKQDRTISSSGGAFSAFARIVLSQNGIVFGASMDSKFHCRHIEVDNLGDLSKLRGSKYVQSELGDSFARVKECLTSGKTVLFSGTPCQVAGLYAYLGQRYEGQLITLDLVCHGVPSQQAFTSYINKLEREKNNQVTAFNFRKYDSWSIVPSIQYEEGNWQRLNLWENAYMNSFFRGLIFRESCYSCNYCTLSRVGTYTIADFWGIGAKGIPFNMNISKGVSLVLDNYCQINTHIEQIKELAFVEERPLEEAIAEQHNLKMPVERPALRDKAVELINDDTISLKEYSAIVGLPYKYNCHTFLLKVAKDVVDKLNIYGLYKTISYKLGKIS